MARFAPQMILVAFDFSKPSVEAWKYARALARRLQAGLEAIYVCQWFLPPDGVLVTMPPPLTPSERDRIEQRMARLLGRPLAARIAEGDALVEILRAAENAQADLIIMGSHGRTGFRRLAAPSLTEAVMRASKIPVLSIRQAGDLPRKILAPVNLEPYSIAGYEAAADLAGALGGTVTLLHVAEAPLPDAQLRRLQEAARRKGALLKVRQGRPVPSIVEESSKHDLVVLVAHRKGALHDAILGTTAEQVLRRSKAPVLAVPVLREPEAAGRRAAAKGRRGLGGPTPRRGRPSERPSRLT